MFNTKRLLFVTFFSFLFIFLSAAKLGIISEANTKSFFVPSITATNAVSLAIDVDSDTKADVGDTLQYSVTISNSGTDATGVTMSDILAAQTTLVGGSVNTTPIASNDSYNAVGNVGITVPVASGLLANDVDPDGNTLTITTAPTTSAQGGTVSITTSGVNAGAYTYNPPVGYEGADSFSYTISDGTATNSATVTINVSGMIWFVNNNGGACASTCNGRLSNPFTTLAAFNTANGLSGGLNPDVNDNIFIYESAAAYSGAVTLRSGQKLVGQDATATLATVTGLTPQSYSNALPAMNTGGSTSNIINTVTLNTNATVRGISINSTTTTAIDDPAGAITGVNVSEVSVATTTATAISLSSLGGTLSFYKVSANGAAKGIALSSTTGSFSVVGDGTNTAGSGGTIQNISQNGVEFILSSNILLKYINFVNANTTDAAVCDAVSGNSGCNGAVYLKSVNTAMLNNVNISGTTSQMGINANDVTNLAVQSSTVTNCGNNLYEGCLTANSLKGTSEITNSTLSVSAQRVVNITNLGSETLTLNVSGSTFSDAPEDGLLFQLTGTTVSGTATLNVNNSSFLRNQNSGINAQNSGNSTMTFNMNGSTVDPGTGVGLGIGAVSFGNGTGRSTFNFNIGTNAANTIRGRAGVVANVLMQGNSDGQGRIQNNLIQKVFSGAGGNAGSYINAKSQEYSTLKIDITGNQCKPVNTSGAIIADLTTFGGTGATTQFGIEVGVASGSTTVVETARTDAYVHNNTVFVNGSFNAIEVPAGGGVSAASTYITCAQVTNNITTQQNVNARSFRLRSGNSAATVRLATSGSGGTDDLSRMKYAWDNNSNTPVSTTNANTVVISGPGIYSLVALNTCLSPSNPPAFASEVITKENETKEVASTTPESTEKTLEQPSNWYANFAKSPLKITPSLSPESGETISKGPFTLPAGKSVTITFRATVDSGPFAAGLNSISNSASVSGSNFATVSSNSASILLDAAPDLSVTKTEGGGTTQPSGTVTYTLTYANSNAVNSQNATGVVITETVPNNTTFNSAGSSAGWSCANGSVGGTICTNTIGVLNAGANGTKTFAVNVLATLPAVSQLSNTATIADDAANGTDLNTVNNTGNDTTPIVGVWLGGTSTDWFTAANWSSSTIPPSGNNIVIPTSVNLPNLTTTDATATNLMLTGQDLNINANRTLTVTGNLDLGSRTVVGSGTIALGASGTITRTSGQINTTLLKTFGGIGSFTFPVGTANGYSPLIANVTIGTGSLSVKAVQTVHPNVQNPASAIARYWTLNGSGITTDLTFNYLQTDVIGVNENLFKMQKFNAGVLTGIFAHNPPNVVINTTANTVLIKNISSFSDWTFAQLVPTAASATISGKLVNQNGRGLRKVQVMLSGGQLTEPRIVSTDYFGKYQFDDVAVGQDYVVTPISGRYRFLPESRVQSLTENLTNVDFIGGLQSP
jgi:trimeric autotransporter adhesin